MNSFLNWKITPFLGAILVSTRLLAAETNAPTAITRDEITANYLHIQEQIHEAQIAIQQSQQAALEAAQNNATALATRLQSLEQSVAQQRTGDAEAARKTQQLTLFMAGAFGLAGLGIMLLMVYFQWRAFTQLAEISQQQHVALAHANGVQSLAAPGRATVESSNTRLLDAVSRLEQRIEELEGGQQLLPEIIPNKSSDLLQEGQTHLDANLPVKALECFDKFLTIQPERPEALVKRAAALEKLGREDEALASYNRAIAKDATLVVAHLQKGGLLNRLRRYDEALESYERALQAQEKKPATNGVRQDSN